MKKIMMGMMGILLVLVCGHAQAAIRGSRSPAGDINSGRATAVNHDLAAEKLEYRTHNGPATESVKTNQMGRIFATVRNKGIARTEGVKMRITVDGATVLEESPAIAPNEPWEFVLVHNFTDPGRHTIAFVVDPDSRLEEINENNNRLEKTVAASPPGYNLAASAIECNSARGARNVSSAYRREQVEFTGTVTNNGDTPVMGVRIALLVDGPSLRDATVDLEPGRTATLTAARAFNDLGRHSVVFSVDTNNSYQETNEGDNRIEKTIEVTTNPIEDAERRMEGLRQDAENAQNAMENEEQRRQQVAQTVSTIVHSTTDSINEVVRKIG